MANKKYTIMFFGADRLGKVKIFNITRNSIILVCTIFVFSLGFLGASIVKIKNMYTEIDNLVVYNEENSSLKRQLEILTNQIDNISIKITEIDEFEYKIRDLVTLQKDRSPLKPIAVGGREIDLLRQYAASAAVNEKEFFLALNDTLSGLTGEVSQRELTLSELASSIEEKRLVMSYTPTIMPVDGWISSNFGYRMSPFTNRKTFHEGLDIAARAGTDVKATGAGVVIFAGMKAGFGNMVIVDHGYGYITKYGHNDKLFVNVGDKIGRGQLVAKVGSSGLSTGAHLHYEVLVNGIPVNPLKFIVELK